VRASPLAVVGVALFVLAPVRHHLAGLRHQAVRLTQPATLALVGAAALASELWQLHRFGFI
jgi:hypothetical protein